MNTFYSRSLLADKANLLASRETNRLFYVCSSKLASIKHTSTSAKFSYQRPAYHKSNFHLARSKTLKQRKEIISIPNVKFHGVIMTVESP